MPDLNRRDIIRLAPLSAISLLGLPARSQSKQNQLSLYSAFPAQDPARVREIMIGAHRSLDAIQAQVEASPALANACVDWGFGDWESAIGAAAHMGHRDIAEFLIGMGGRPDIFVLAMLGNVDAVRALVKAHPGIQKLKGPHSFTLMHHARAGGKESTDVVAYLEELGGADEKPDYQPLPNPVEAYTGNYSYGPGEEDSFEIEERNGNLSLRAGEGFGRALSHLGSNVFHPTGANSVRIKFEFRPSVKVSITDHELILSAVKS